MRISLDIPLYTKEIAKLFGISSIKVPLKITAIATDSREVIEGDLFIALSGENGNGEDYVKEAISKGSAAVSMQKLDGALTVTDTAYALQKIANYYKKKLKNLKYTVGITGSVGKTTTKNFLKIISEGKYKTHATAGNYNNHIGLPLTILSAKSDTEVLVLEMGMNHSGEISRLSKCAEPDIGIITNIGTAHIGNLGSRENIAKAKLEILEGMKIPRLAVPYGENMLNGSFERTTFSSQSTLADIYIIYNEGKTFLIYNNEKTELSFIPRGTHMLECLAAAVSVSLKIGVGASTLKRRISMISSNISGQTPKSLTDFYILADYYNASLESINASLNLLSSMEEYKYKSALLGTVKETGTHSVRIHKEIGRLSALSGIRNLYLFSEFATVMAEGAESAGMNPDNIFINTDETAPEITASQISEHHINGELILFKASHRADLGRIVKLLES